MSHCRLLVASVAAAFWLAGCASTTPTFDANFSDSVRILRAQQTMNAAAPVANKDRAVVGMDGRAARETIERYERSFIEPQRVPNVFTIGIGSGIDTVGPAGR